MLHDDDGDEGAGDNYSQNYSGPGTGGSSGDGVYQPPRIAAMPYDEDDSADVRKKKKEARERSKFLNSSMMQELRSEFSSAPREESHVDTFKDSVRKEMTERENVEEERFVRLGGRKKILVSTTSQCRRRCRRRRCRRSRKACASSCPCAFRCRHLVYQRVWAAVCCSCRKSATGSNRG